MRKRPTAPLLWWRIAWIRSADHLQPYDHLRDGSPTVVNHDDDSGSARDAPSFMMMAGRALVVALRVSISAGERSRDRHRG